MTVSDRAGHDGVDDEVEAELEDAEGVEDGEGVGGHGDGVLLEQEAQSSYQGEGEAGDSVDRHHDGDQLCSLQ